MKFLLTEDAGPLSDYNKKLYSKNNKFKKLKELNPKASDSFLKNIAVDELKDLAADNLTSGQRYKVLWQCPVCHNDYVQEIQSRAKSRRYSSCPVCMESGTSDSEKSIYKQLGDIIRDNKDDPRLENVQLFNKVRNILPDNREIDILLKDIDGKDWGIEYDGAFWHKEEDLERDKYKDFLCKELGLNLIRLREKTCPKYEPSSNVVLLPIEKTKIDKTCEDIFKIILGDISTLKLPTFNRDDFMKYTPNKSALLINVGNDSLLNKCPEVANRYKAARIGRSPLNKLSVDFVNADCSNRYAWFKCRGCGEIFLCIPKTAQEWDGKDCSFHYDKLIYIEDVPSEKYQKYIGRVSHKREIISKITGKPIEEDLLTEERRSTDPRDYGVEYRDATKEEIEIFNKQFVDEYKEKEKGYLM